MRYRLFIIAGALIVIGAAAAGALYYAYPVEMATYAGMTRNYFISLVASAGTVTRESNAAYKGAGTVAPSPRTEAAPAGAAAGDWPGYNRTLTSERYSPLSQINTKNVGKLNVLCTYDVRQFAAFESGLIMVDNALIGTTQFDIFSLNPATCAENWRTHEDYPPPFCPPTEAPPIWTACCFAAPRTGGCWPMTSRPASEFGKRQSRT
jgi:alcohol dehydrogenase (cytochrome c)